jgi:stearoyl-CoA desaturase (Delta-9 desaturase)
MAIFFLLVMHWYSSLFFQSIFHHRYAAHGIFTMSRGWEKAFYIGCYLAQGSSYISAYAYGILHRLHHVHTDTEKDPHSPQNSANLLMMMWQTRNNYYDIFSGKVQVDEKIKKGLPRWDAFDRIAHTWVSRFLWFGIYTLFYLHFATAWWMYLFLPIHFAMGSIQGAIVNWWAHRFGYSNFEVDNTSKNIIPIDLIFWGESYHNNHHKYPGRPNNSVKWFEFDPGFHAMQFLDKLKIIHLKNAGI